MATWQESNGAGLLAGIGGNNSNAPQAGDNRLALGLIRENNEMARSGANNPGLQVLGGLSGLAGLYQQSQQQERQKEFQSAYGTAFSSGDRNAMRNLAAKYPEQFEAVQKGMGFIDDDQKATIGNIATSAQIASTQGPEAFGTWLTSNSSDLKRAGFNPQNIAQMYQSSPEGFSQFAGNMAMFSLGPEKYFEAQDKLAGREIDRGRLAETERSNRASEGLTFRAQNISAENSRRAANSPTTAMQNYELYSRLLKENPEEAALFAQSAGIKTGPTANNRQVQLSDGRTVNVGGKLHGAGANAFYEGIDDLGNMVRVPANAIAAPATSAANAQNYAMKKDVEAILNAPPSKLNFMTGMTGGVGEPALLSEQRSRIKSADERNLFTATRRIQGKMQNQGIAAARDMGASGINTVAEAKMYFQGMPQVDYSSPESMQNSIREIQQYTDNYNQQYNVNIGSSPARAPAASAAPVQPAVPASGGYSSLWGG